MEQRNIASPNMMLFTRDWGCQMDPENMERFDSEEEIRADAMYPVMLDKWQR